MSLALDVSLSSLKSIVDVSTASPRKAGVGMTGTGSQMSKSSMEAGVLTVHSHAHTY